MFVRLSGELIDLRTVKKVSVVNGDSYRVDFKAGGSTIIKLEGANPINNVDLANAMITIFDNLVDND